MTSTRHTSAALLLSLLLASCVSLPALAANEKTSELAGTWFVLIHYTDESTAHPERERWLDRVWTFEVSGTRLKWTDYPIVVIQDASGRFEATAGNPRSRVLASWEPNQTQLEEIMGGPRVNSRGSKTKTLKGSDARGWKTVGRGAYVASASVVGYHETWSVERKDGNRVFSFADTLGSMPSASEDGLTRYTELSKSPDGSEIRGSYVRDGIRRGSFRMFRTPPIRGLITSEDTEETVNERHIRKNLPRILKAYGEE